MHRHGKRGPCCAAIGKVLGAVTREKLLRGGCNASYHVCFTWYPMLVTLRAPLRNPCVGVVVVIVSYAFYIVPCAGNARAPMRNLCVVVVVVIVSYVFYMVPYAGNARASVCSLCVNVVAASFPVCFTWCPMLVTPRAPIVTSAW